MSQSSVAFAAGSNGLDISSTVVEVYVLVYVLTNSPSVVEVCTIAVPVVTPTVVPAPADPLQGGPVSYTHLRAHET